jgi:hypothetical protein
MGLKQPQTELVHSLDMVVDIYPEVCVFYQSSLNTVKVGRIRGQTRNSDRGCRLHLNQTATN